MNDPVAATSRAAAQRLTAEFGGGVVADLEAVLQGRPPGAPDQFFDPISVSVLIVEVAHLAWSIYEGRHRRTEKPAEAASEDLARRIRVKVGSTEPVTTAERDRIIEVVVTETINTATSAPVD